MLTKDRKIVFHTLVKDMWVNNAEGLEGKHPFDIIEALIKYIISIRSKKARFYELKNAKTCLLDTADISFDDNKNKIITGFFKSARHTFRPNLLDTADGNERPSPKKLSEGDIEKTHFIIKITDEEVLFLLETNGNGISMQQIVNYFTKFTKDYLISIGLKKNFTLRYGTILRNNFLTELGRLQRSKTAEVHFNKSFMGTGALNFSDRTVSLKRDLVLTATAIKGKDITETVVDIYNKFKQAGNNSISKVRVYGKDEESNDVILDTSFLETVEFLTVNLNVATGEVETADIIRGLKQIVNNF